MQIIPRSAPAVTLVLPCYNEMEHIQVSFAKISKIMNFSFARDAYEIILVDDGSTDGTREWLANLSDPNVRVHLNEKNLGRGGAVKRGFELARGSVVGFMDIDCEISEAYLPRFTMAIADGADLAVGNRIYNTSLLPYILVRHFLSLGYKALLKFVIGAKVRDSEVGYKFFSRRYAKYLVAASRFDDWFFDTEVCLLAEAQGINVEEITVAFCRNPDKTSSVHVFRDSWAYLRALAAYRKLVKAKAYQPLVAGRASDVGRRGA